MTQALTGATRVAGIIGDPVRHSRSPAIWNAAFASSGLDWVFVAFPVAPGEAADALQAVRTLELAGVTVTMPHKAAAAAACDELSDTASALGAVNVVRNDDRKLWGDSTDGEGFLRSLADEDIDPAGRRSVVIGAGGAGRAIAHALGTSGADVIVAARRMSAAKDAAMLAPGGRAVALADVRTEIPDAALVVNATPLGMGDEAPPFDVGALDDAAIVVDTVYHPLETPLLASARARGLHAVGGLGMLVHQAAVSFGIFTGRDAPLDAMHAAAAGVT